MCKQCGRILGVAYFAPDLDNPFETLDVCKKCMNDATKPKQKCNKCGRLLPSDKFPKTRGAQRPQSICTECRKPFLSEMLAIAKKQRVACSYTTTCCYYSERYGMCCFDCPIKEWCEDACGNKPLPEPNGCGCITKW